MALDTGTAAGIDEAYEFSAPRFFDFVVEETEEAVRAAESWFEAARSHAPSRMYSRAAEAFLVDRRLFPDLFSLFWILAFNPRIKESRAEVKLAVLCDFAQAEEPAPEVNKRKGIALAPSSSVILSIPPRSSRLAIYIFVNCAGGARGGGSRKRLGTRSRCY